MLVSNPVGTGDEKDAAGDAPAGNERDLGDIGVNESGRGLRLHADLGGRFRLFDVGLFKGLFDGRGLPTNDFGGQLQGRGQATLLDPPLDGTWTDTKETCYIVFGEELGHEGTSWVNGRRL
jgi:hypothetical protein